MADIRVRIAKDKEKLVKSLKASADDPKTPFPTYVEVLVFAASLGIKKGEKTPIKEVSDIDPIRQDIFTSRGLDKVIDLLAIADTKDPKILASDEVSEAQRVQIFEEYANTGLEILQTELKGVVNITDKILLILKYEVLNANNHNDEFDLRNFL